tara:strand:- start:371 stop:592 length:222 start_codon:yes stop_codon:yes gene_type:complete
MKIMKNNKKIIKNKKNYSKIIDQIEEIRGKNNTNWMNILRLSFKKSPEQTAKILSKIYVDDKRIGILAKKLIN